MELLIGVLWGFMHGVRHAFEPDHLAAVSTLAASRTSGRSVVRFAAAWGLGHGATLLVVAGALLLLRTRMPEPVATAFELCVALTLVVLGVRALWQSRSPARERAHHHHESTQPLKWPLAVGLLHGLAGSGALAAGLVLTMRGAIHGVLLVLLYAVGALSGMVLLAIVLSRPVELAARREKLHAWLMGLSGAISVAAGVWWTTQHL